MFIELRDVYEDNLFLVLFVSQENSETPPTTMGRDRRGATLRFGGCPHFPIVV